MLQAMRSNLKGTVAAIVVGFLSFILVGSLLQFSGGNSGNNPEAASVDGNPITEFDLLRSIEGRRQGLIAELGDQLPPDFLSNERLRPLTLDGLIDYYLLINAALDGQMTVSDQSLDAHIIASPQFQVEGRYNPEQLRNWLRRMGYTAPGFKEVLKKDIVANQLQRSLVDSGFVTDAEWMTAASLALQTRDFTAITLPLNNAQQAVTIAEEEIQSFYDNNQSSYLTDEQVAVDYIEVTVDQIANTITIDDDAIRRQYEQELAAYVQQTEREAAHILIEDNEESADRIAKVAAALASGEDFAALAKQYSDDIGSKDAGGAVGFTMGDIFPPNFEAALSVLNVGQVSDAVTTEAGTHFIKLLSVRETQAPTFEEERQRIEQQLQSTQAEERFIEIVDTLKDLSYNAEQLTDVAARISDEKLTLNVRQTELFSRTTAPDVLANSAVNTAVFSDQVIKEGYASDVIEVAEDHVVVVKMITYQPVRTLTLEEKRSEIEAALKREKIKQNLAARAETLRDSLAAGTDMATLAAAEGLTVTAQTASKRDNREIDPELLNFVFSISRPSNGQPTIDGAHLANGDYVLISLSHVEDPPLTAITGKESASLRDNLERVYSRDEFTAWQSQMRANADIEITSESDRAAIPL